MDLYSAASHTRTHSTRVLQDAGRVTSVGDSVELARHGFDTL